MKLNRILLAALVTIVSACDSPAIFSSSLSEPGETAIDDSVVGTWYMGESKDATIVLKIARVGGDRLGVVLDVWDSSSSSEERFREETFSYHMMAHPSEMNGKRYYNVAIFNAASLAEFVPAEKLEELEGFMIHKARVVDDDWLVVYALMENVPEKLAGWSKSNSSRVANSPKYSVSRDNLRGLIATAESDGQFHPFLFFRRLPIIAKESIPAEIRDVPRWKM